MQEARAILHSGWYGSLIQGIININHCINRKCRLHKYVCTISILFYFRIYFILGFILNILTKKCLLYFFNWSIVYLQCFANYCCKAIQLCTFMHSLFIFFFIIIYHRILNIVLVLWSSSVQSLSRVLLFVTPWTAAHPGLPVRH